MRRFTLAVTALTMAGFLALQGCERRSTLDQAASDIKEGANDAARGVGDAVD